KRRATGHEGQGDVAGGRRRWWGGRPRGRPLLFFPRHRGSHGGEGWSRIGWRGRTRCGGCAVGVGWGWGPHPLLGGTPLVPAEREGAQDEGPVPADGAIGTDLEVGPAE